MPGQKCTVCGSTKTGDPSASFHRFPKDARRAIWLSVFDIAEEALRPSTRVCSRHFPGGDATMTPSLTLGKPSIVFKEHVAE